MGFKIPFIKDEGYTISLEPYPNAVFAHCAIHSKHKVGATKRAVSKWKEFRNITCNDFYALHNVKDNKPTKKFLTVFGFVFSEERRGKDGNMYEIWINRGDSKCQ